MSGASAREALLDMYARHGRMNPQLVVDESRAEDAPLHDRFEWDDSLAGEAHRRDQAARMIRMVRVEPPGQTEPCEVRVFIAAHALTSTGAETEPVGEELAAGEYLHIDEVVADPVKRTAYEQRLESEWRSLHRRARQFGWFTDLVLGDLGVETD